jgi:hypothetical protein
MRQTSTEKGKNMSPAAAARATLKLLEIPDEEEGEQSHIGVGQSHLIFMLRQIASWGNTEKAHRWLGWAQCLAVCLGLTDLDAMKQINKEA